MEKLLVGIYMEHSKEPWVCDLRGGCCAIYQSKRAGEKNGISKDDDRNIAYSNKGAFLSDDFEGVFWRMNDQTQADFSRIVKCVNACEGFDNPDYMRVKAEAYDRIMSGGKKTLKEWANLLGRPVAMDFGGVVESYNTIPMRCDSAGYWYCDEYSENFEDEHFIIPKECFDFTGSWQDSLTLPDGWEEKR